VFQIRSSWTQFLMSERFLRVEDSITCVFSMNLHSPIPSAGTIFKACAINRLGPHELRPRSMQVRIPIQYCRRGNWNLHFQ
jgi:hypothetical protein